MCQKSLKSVLHYSDISTDMECKIGDGIGESETKLEGSYTIQECIDVVQQTYPNANGVTTSNPCKSEECKCYAEFGMTHWNEDKKQWQSCMFKEGNLNAAL